MNWAAVRNFLYNHRTLILGTIAVALAVGLFLAFPPAGIAPMVAFMVEGFATLPAFGGSVTALIAAASGMAAAITLGGGMVINSLFLIFDSVKQFIRRRFGRSEEAEPSPAARQEASQHDTSLTATDHDAPGGTTEPEATTPVPTPLSDAPHIAITHTKTPSKLAPLWAFLGRHRSLLLGVLVAGVTVGLFCAFPPAGIAPMMVFLLQGFATFPAFGGSVAAVIATAASMASAITLGMGMAVNLFWNGVDFGSKGIKFCCKRSPQRTEDQHDDTATTGLEFTPSSAATIQGRLGHHEPAVPTTVTADPGATSCWPSFRSKTATVVPEELPTQQPSTVL